MTPESGLSPLCELATAHGVAVDGAGGSPVPEQTVRLVLEALGVPASTDGEVRLSLATHRAQWRPLPAAVTARAGRGERVAAWVPEGRTASALVTTAAGRERQLRVEPRPDLARPAGRDRVVPVTVVVPGDLPVGQHLLTLDFEVSGVSVPLLVAPQVFPSLPSAHADWGLGGATGLVRAEAGREEADLGDLAELVSWVGADLDGHFVIQPPVLRAGVPFADAQMVRPHEVPEHAALDDGGREAVRRGDRVTALRALYAAPRGARRQRAFDAFCVAGGQALLDHATWLVIAGRHGNDVSLWPAPLRDAGGDEVARLREASADEVNFHRWCQWVADEQLAEAAREARRTGMGLGLVAPLTAPGSASASQAWSLGASPARGVRLGRPPGAGLPEGAVGDQAPWSPTVVRDLGYAPLRRQLEGASRHAGGLLLTLPERWLRQWWVPDGLPASAGTWVEQDHEALLAAVGIAAHRTGAVVLAELHGLVEREAQWLASQGVLPLAEAGALERAGGPPSGAAGGTRPLRWVDVGALADGGELTLERLAGSPAARRRARRLTR
ncbi:MAG TPA: 4-alpha-glucanotransferase [Pedococcus sp.]|uniref:4-alpha-glucanotransferase n=1 Tax=Pedococcus sp. TaxID=2860345 RepID=UPI002F955A58